MNAFAATQAEERTITKPPEWAVYMVTAALKCASDERLPTTHVSQDEARFQILKSLNFFEAHNQYEWPDFTSFHYDFNQVMRLRRALVQDVFNALEKAGNLSVSIPGTPDSNAGRGLNSRKRLCKREAEIDQDTVLLDAMAEIIDRANVDVGNRDAHELADVIHDHLVEVWTRPLQATGDRLELLTEKADAWDRLRRSQLPRLSSTPRRTPAVAQVSPDTVPKPLVSTAPAPRAA